LSQNQGPWAKQSLLKYNPTNLGPAVGAIAEDHRIKDVGFAVNIPAVAGPARRPGRTPAGSSVLMSAWEADILWLTGSTGSSAPMSACKLTSFGRQDHRRLCRSRSGRIAGGPGPGDTFGRAPLRAPMSLNPGGDLYPKQDGRLQDDRS